MANLAIRRLVRGADGSARIIFVDLVTFLPVYDLTGYTVVDQGIELQEEPVEDVKQPDKEAPPEEKGPSPYDSKGERSDGASSRFGASVPTSKSIIADARKTTVVTPNQKPTIVNPVKEATVVNPVKEVSQEARVVPTEDTISPVKTTQGSILPDLKMDRFSPPTAESIAAQSVDSAPVSPVTNGTGAVNPTKETGLAPNKESTTPTGVGFAAPNRPGVPGTPTDVAGYNANYGTHRRNAISGDLASKIVDAARKVDPGATVEGFSGQGQYGTARHRQEEGVAVDARAYDSQGNLFSPDQTRDFASQFAYANPNAGIGYGATYMGPNEVHLDTTGFGGQWGAKNAKGKNTRAMMQRDDMALDQTIDAARRGFAPTPFANAPTPFSPTDATPDYATRETGTGTIGTGNLDDSRARAYAQNMAPTGVTKTNSVFDSMVDNVGTTAKAIKDQARATTNNRQRVDTAAIGNMTPAQYGVTTGKLATRTAAQNSLIDKAIAGELHGNTLRGLAVGDPDAMKEYANVRTSIENRAASKKYGTLEKTFAPDAKGRYQYNAFDAGNLATTNANLKAFGPALAKANQAYQNGQISPTDWGISSYYNADIASPSWGLGMTNTAKTGYHTFGSLSEYGPSGDFKAERDRVSRDVKGAQQSYSGVNGGGDLDSPSEKSGIGRGSRLGSRKSDSKSQAGSGGTSRGQSRGASGSRSQPGSGGTTRGSKSTSSKGQPGSGGSSRGSSKSAGSQPGSGGIGRGSASKSAKAEKSKAEKTDKSGSEGRR